MEINFKSKFNFNEEVYRIEEECERCPTCRCETFSRWHVLDVDTIRFIFLKRHVTWGKFLIAYHMENIDRNKEVYEYDLFYTKEEAQAECDRRNNLLVTISDPE